MKYLLTIVLVSLVATIAVAQKPKAPKEKLAPGRTVATEEKAGTASDTVKFKAAFKELFPLIRPTPSVKERAETQLMRMSRMFKMQGVDSAHAHDSVMLALNPNEDDSILYKAYRENFNAEELKSLTAFFKTPAGKHYLEVEQRIIGARTGSIEQYVQRTINQVIMPMRKPPERKPGAPGMPPGPGMRPGMRGMPNQPGMPPKPGEMPGAPELPPGAPQPPSMSGHPAPDTTRAH